MALDAEIEDKYNISQLDVTNLRDQSSVHGSLMCVWYPCVSDARRNQDAFLIFAIAAFFCMLVVPSATLVG